MSNTAALLQMPFRHSYPKPRLLLELVHRQGVLERNKMLPLCGNGALFRALGMTRRGNGRKRPQECHEALPLHPQESNQLSPTYTRTANPPTKNNYLANDETLTTTPIIKPNPPPPSSRVRNISPANQIPPARIRRANPGPTAGRTPGGVHTRGVRPLGVAGVPQRPLRGVLGGGYARR